MDESVVFEVLIIATDKDGRIHDYVEYVEDYRPLCFHVAQRHTEYSTLVARGICLVYTINVHEMSNEEIEAL